MTAAPKNKYQIKFAIFVMRFSLSLSLDLLLPSFIFWPSDVMKLTNRYLSLNSPAVTTSIARDTDLQETLLGRISYSTIVKFGIRWKKSNLTKI